MAFLGSLQLEHGTPAGTARFRCVQLLQFIFRVVRFLALNLSSCCWFAVKISVGCYHAFSAVHVLWLLERDCYLPRCVLVSVAGLLVSVTRVVRVPLLALVG